MLIDLENLVGKTPMAKILCKYKRKIKTIYAKLEWYNLSGSIKDRIALFIIKKSYDKHLLRKHQEIVETTSGNTGISFAVLGGLLNHKVTIIMPDWLSEERKKIIALSGANLKLISKQEGGFLKGIEMLDDLEGVFLPKQFENHLNVDCHYETTGCEIISQLESSPKCFVSGVGTGGTLIGVGKRLKQSFKNVKVVAIEPKSSPILKVGYKVGNHKIQGISDDFIPKIYQPKLVDEIIDVSDEEAIYFAQALAKKGLGVGISSGANFFGALECSVDEVVTVFADDNKKYISTDLANPITLDIDFEILNIEFIAFKKC